MAKSGVEIAYHTHLPLSAALISSRPTTKPRPPPVILPSPLCNHASTTPSLYLFNRELRYSFFFKSSPKMSLCHPHDFYDFYTSVRKPMRHYTLNTIMAADALLIRSLWATASLLFRWD